MRGVAAIILLITLAGLSLWWLLSLQTAQQADGSDLLATPKLVLDKFEATRLDEHGLRQYQLSAPQLVQWTGTRGIEIEQPKMVLYRDGRFVLWRLEAEQAWLSEDRQTVQLRDAVEAIRDPGNPAERLHISSRDLIYRPQDNTLTTDGPVRLTTAHGEMSGRGLHGQMDQQFYTLLSAVRGQYAPPP